MTHTPRELIGKTLALVLASGRERSPYTIRWRVIGYGSAMLRLRATNSKHTFAIDWPEIRNHIDTGRIEVEP